MAKRRAILAALATLLLAAGVGFWLAWPAPTQITMENASRIKKGMTLAEVEAILGGPPRDELQGHSQVGVRGYYHMNLQCTITGPLWRTHLNWTAKSEFSPIEKLLPWTSSECHVQIGLGKDDRVLTISIEAVQRRTEYGLFFLKK